ncbi:MAG: MATE family efflux transporter [Planctomycetes bacterium]|nr:MATE family efflux transporter [Planctomycetota bacterium]
MSDDPITFDPTAPSGVLGVPQDATPAVLVPAPSEVWAGVGWVRADLRLLVGLAGANVASMVAQTAMSLVDYYVVSLLPGAVAAQAAVSSGSLVFFAVFGLLMGTMICTTTVVSQWLGAGRHRDCSVYAWQGIWMSLLFGLLAFALWPVVPGLFALFGHEPDVLAMETVYTRVRLLSLGAAGAQTALSHYFVGIHRPWSNTHSAIWSNVLNAGLTYGMVLGKWGLPAMGVAGAAWATVIATVIRMVWLLVAMCYGPTAEQFHARRTWGWDGEKAGRLLRVGWPSGLQFVLDIGAWAAFLVWIVGLFGKVHMAATATVWRYTELSFMPAVGIGMAVSTMVGRAIGERRIHLAYRRARLGAMLNVAYMGLMALLFVVLGRPLMEVFSRDPNVIGLGVELLVFAAVFQMFDAVAITYNNALRGAGDTRWPAVVGATQAWTIMIGCGYVTARCFPQFGSRGPWLFATLFVIVVGITFYVRWRRAEWEKLDVIGRDAAIEGEFGRAG